MVKDYFESASAKIELSDGATVGVLRNTLESLYPALKELSCYMVAVNDEYTEDDLALNEKDTATQRPQKNSVKDLKLMLCQT
ncbi:MAG: MoaD/ThiS family protein [Agriterribacter sp.]